MDLFGPALVQGLTVAFLLVVFVLPGVVIVQKTGRSGWWGLLVLIPVVNIIAIWVFAYVRWPALEPRTEPAQ